jgi:hypothetical protein
MDFMADYWSYHSCYEIPRNYAFWAGFGLLGAVVHKKVSYLHGDLEIFPPIYVGLVGPQGSSKSTCCSFAREFFREACPELKIGPSRASPEAIAKTMSETTFIRQFTDVDGQAVEVRPFSFFINEFKNFVGRSPFDMLTFLTDIYDVRAYDASSIARGLEFIINPSVNLIFCETPDWIIRNIKGDIISGGFGRRVVYAYELDDVTDKPMPIITADARTAIDRCRKRLREARAVVGKYRWDVQGFRYYDKWYRDTAAIRRKENNTMMKGYLKTKHIQVFKVMMLLDCVKDKPMLTFNSELLEEALSFTDVLELNMMKLFAAAGRNELLLSQYKVLDHLERSGSWMEEAALKVAIQNELSPVEIFSVLRHLEDTEQIIRKQVNFPGRGERWAFILPKLYKQQINSGDIAVVNKRTNEIVSGNTARSDGITTSQEGRGNMAESDPLEMPSSSYGNGSVGGSGGTS